MSRKEDRKNARLAKKQRKSLHHQKMIDIRKKGPSNLSIPSKKAVVQAHKAKQPQTQKSKQTKSSNHFKLSETVDEEDDEEIFSDSDAYVEEEEDLKIESASDEESEDEMSSEDDFLSMMDKAFASGKLTKDGFVGKNGKIESGQFGNLNKEVDEDDDESLDEDFEMLEDEEEDSENSEVEEPQEAKEKDGDTVTEADTFTPQKSHSMLRKIKTVAGPVETSENAKLLRQIQSLVNKLGASNIVPICNDFETIFRNNRRKEVIELLTDTIIGSIVKPGGNLLDSFALNFASLSFIINHMVGIEFGAHLIEKLIETIDSLYIKAKEFTSVNIGTEDTNIHERSLVNCMNFCSFLYDLQMISSNLICDLLRQSADRLDEIDVEIILKLFKTCGQQIKRDDADFMKVISASITKKSLELPKEKQSSRFKFMVETINDLKDSKRKLASAMTVELEPIKKMLKNFLTQKLMTKIEPLRISLEDIRNIESKGKWWLVGSSWHPQTASEVTEKENNSSSATSNRNEELEKIEKLAKAQRMNTELRKSIFSTIVSSDDFSDAFERLLSLKLTGKQEREIILVIVHCCGQEKTFNPFYAMLAGKFASYRQTFKITLQYTLWDAFKQIKEYPLRKLSNVAKLFGTLLAQEDLPFSVLRKGNFIRLSEEEKIFWQLLFMTIFTRIPSDDELTEMAQNFVTSIETGMSDASSSLTGSKSTKKIVSLTENVDMAEFDDDFFAAQDKLKSGCGGMSPEKLEECKALRDGLIYFLETGFIKSKDFPFTVGIETCIKRAKLFKQILSN